jgi:hypothetical protein
MALDTEKEDDKKKDQLKMNRVSVSVSESESANLRIHSDTCQNMVKVSHLLFLGRYTEWNSEVEVATVDVGLYVVSLRN